MLTHITFLNLGTLCKDRQQTLRDVAVWNENGGSSFIAGAQHDKSLSLIIQTITPNDERNRVQAL